MKEPGQDLNPKRATYKVWYPGEDEVIEFKTKDDFRKEGNPHVIEKSKVLFTFEKAYCLDHHFIDCQFFKESAENSIKQITFKGCHFTRCFMGSNAIQRVRFENCIFTNCDFSNTIFASCILNLCLFIKCSAYHVDFINTEINPQAFLDGINFLEENYSSPTQEFKNEFVFNKLSLAKKIYTSNNSIDNHNLSDLGLFYLKKIELSALNIEIGKLFREKKWYSAFSKCFFTFFKWLNLKVTKGGTSLSRLFKMTAFLILLFNLYFTIASISDQNYTYNVSDHFLLKFVQWLPKTFSIFLAYGYTSFKTSSGLDFTIINICVIFGIIMYAMLISILVRKIYK